MLRCPLAKDFSSLTKIKGVIVMKNQLLRELISTLMTWGTIVYVFFLGLIAVESGRYVEVMLKGLMGLVIGWILVIIVVSRYFLRKKKKVE